MVEGGGGIGSHETRSLHRRRIDHHPLGGQRQRAGLGQSQRNSRGSGEWGKAFWR